MSEKITSCLMRLLVIPIGVFGAYACALVLSEKIVNKIGYNQYNLKVFIFTIMISSFLAFVFTTVVQFLTTKVIDKKTFKKWYHYTHLLFGYFSGLISVLLTIEPELINASIIPNEFDSNYRYVIFFLFLTLSNYAIYNSIIINNEFEVFKYNEKKSWKTETAALLEINFRPIRIFQELITFACVSIMIIHIIGPQLAIDSISVTLLAIANTPWIISIIKNIELPGGFKQM